MTQFNVTLSEQMSAIIEDSVRRRGISKEEALKRIFALYKIANDAEKRGQQMVIAERQDGELKICGTVTGF